jgi:hypothetical protein
MCVVLGLLFRTHLISRSKFCMYYTYRSLAEGYQMPRKYLTVYILEFIHV